MATEDDHPVIRDVFASYGWFTHKTHDLVITRDSFLRVGVPKANGPNWPERMRSHPIDRVNDPDRLAAEDGTIVIPYSTVKSLRLYAPPVQSNMYCEKLGLWITHCPEGQRSRKLTVGINANLYIMQRKSTEETPRGLSQKVLRWNGLLSEYATIIKELLLERLPPEVIKEARWDIPTHGDNKT